MTMEDKKAVVLLTKKELSHLINDVIAYMWKIEEESTDEQYLIQRGYYSRKDLKKKLIEIERDAFPEYEI